MKKLTLIFLIAFSSLVVFMTPSSALALSFKDSVCTNAPGIPGCQSTDKYQQLTDQNNPQAGYINAIVDTFVYAAVIVSTIFLFVGGIRYIASGGDVGRITSAKNTIQYAIIGLVVAVLARVIASFIIGRLGG